MNLANGLADVRGISILTLQRGSTQLCAAAWCALLIAVAPAQAEETVCAKVKIEIKQELTLERQAFDAEMKINNTTDTGVLENVLNQSSLTPLIYGIPFGTDCQEWSDDVLKDCQKQCKKK